MPTDLEDLPKRISKVFFVVSLFPIMTALSEAM